MQECNNTEAEGVEQPFTWAVLVFKHCCSLKIHHYFFFFYFVFYRAHCICSHLRCDKCYHMLCPNLIIFRVFLSTSSGSIVLSALLQCVFEPGRVPARLSEEILLAGSWRIGARIPSEVRELDSHR